jgi:hypothetical protein
LSIRVRPGERTLEPIVIEPRYRGPQSSGNGGYTSGLVAARVGARTVEVTLRLPPPLETPLAVEQGEVVRVFHGERLIAEARPAELELDLPEAVPYEEAKRLADANPPDPDHPFPGCFVCGPQGAGLRLRPTPLANGRVVAPWRPEESAPELVWAALDCPGAYAVNPDLARGLTVLGRLTAHVQEVPRPGENCVVVGWPIGADGRRLHAGTAVFRDGAALAWARAVWFQVGDAFRDQVPSPA